MSLFQSNKYSRCRLQRTTVENGLGTIEMCRQIIQDALVLFRKHPDCIVVVE